ncbi:MAG: pentapeptide repeat-containing protein [Actinobacteria bacterium]|nr:pentapeptide repeat-containing protein [Actinomycetota bacterium]
MAVTGKPRRWWTTPNGRIVRLALVLAALAVVLFAVVPFLLTASRSGSSGREQEMADVRSSVITLVAAVGGVLTLLSAVQSYALSQVASLSGRFQDAAKMMAESDAMARLGGIEAMAQLADEWPAERQRCIDMLCAHVRHAVADDAEGPKPVDHHEDTRRRVLDLIRASVADKARPSWQGHHFDLRGTCLHTFDLSHLKVSSVTFDFRGSTFVHSKDGEKQVDLTGSTLLDVELRFDEVTFERGAKLAFDDVHLRASTVRFAEATLENADASFAGATLEGGSVSFEGAKIGDGSVTFRGATIGGDLTFANTTLDRYRGEGLIDFDDTSIRTVVSFDGAEVTRAVTFRGADLRGADGQPGGLSVHTQQPPSPRFDLAGAQVEGAILICAVPDKPIEFDLSAAVGDPVLRTPTADGARSGGNR